MNRTCGERACIAIALHTSGLLLEPTVACLDAWCKISLIKQMAETAANVSQKSGLLERLVKYYVRLELK